MRSISIRIIVVLLASVALVAPAIAAWAQAEDGVWGEFTNLSRSGAADQPRVVAGPGGTVQVFWWDRFDGIVTARFDGQAWSPPALAPIEEVEQVGEEFVTSPAVEAMPTIVGDGRGWAHAFWIGAPDRETGGTPLVHSQLALGSVSWSVPEALAESAVAFDVAAAPGGGLTLAYVRALHSDPFPAGLYVKWTAGGGSGWGGSVNVYGTIYFRLLAAEDAYVRAANGGGGVVYLAWEDPYAEQVLYARSADGGATWSVPEPLGEPEERPARPSVFALPDGGGLRLWEAAGMGGCVLYQQRLAVGQGEADAWSTPQRVLEGVGVCPQGERSWVQDESLFWLWGEGTGTLTLTAWDGQVGRWAEPRSFGFRFQEAGTERWVELSDLHAAPVGLPTGGLLAVAGSDAASGEVWVTVGEAGALVLAPSSPWSAPSRLSQDGADAGWPAAAVDGQGGVHVAWSEAAAAGEPGTSLFYAGWGEAAGRWTRPAEVVRGTVGQEMARQPALLADGSRGLLHLVWSGGDLGQIFYSRAKPAEAASADGWSAPQVLSLSWLGGAWPQIGADAAGRLYVVYVVPLNERRGVYLVRSEDGGETWSEPAAVFDAEAAGWVMVDRPALAVAPDGALHVAWVHGALPGTWDPQGVYYTRSWDGETWDTPWEVAGAGYDWPRLALAGGRVNLLYVDGQVGSVWHRWLEVASEGTSGWRTAAQVPGWEGMGSGLGLAADGGGTLHLVGVDGAGGALRYATWDGERWSAAESLWLGVEVEGGLGAAAAVAPEGGRLAVALRGTAGSGEEALPVVWVVARVIPEVVVPPTTPVPTFTPVPAPTVEVTPTAAPKPTPDLVSGGAPSGGGMLPLILGGGLAVAAVVLVVVVWGVRRGRE